MISRPCVGCGYCCQKAPCAAGGGGQPPCRHLRGSAVPYRCGLVEDATGPARERLVEALAIGAGCCSSLNTQRLHALERARQ